MKCICNSYSPSVFEKSIVLIKWHSKKSIRDLIYSLFILRDGPESKHSLWESLDCDLGSKSLLFWPGPIPNSAWLVHPHASLFNPSCTKLDVELAAPQVPLGATSWVPSPSGAETGAVASPDQNKIHYLLALSTKQNSLPAGFVDDEIKIQPLF